MTHITTLDTSALQAKVDAVVQQTEELNSTINNERDQRTELMALVLDLANPALRAMTSKIKTYSLRQNESGSERAMYHPRPGLRLDGHRDIAGPACDDGERGGDVEGWDTFLLDDGGLLELRYMGSWSAYSNEADCWEASTTHIFAEKAACYLVEEGSDEAALKAISNALDKQISGNTRKRTEKAEDRTQRLKAILTLARTEAT